MHINFTFLFIKGVTCKNQVHTLNVPSVVTPFGGVENKNFITKND